MNDEMNGVGEKSIKETISENTATINKSIGSDINKNTVDKNHIVGEKDSIESKEEGFFGYYLFVFISAIIGFVAVFFMCRIGIVALKESGRVDLMQNRTLISCVAALISVILFMFIALGLKSILRKFFLSEIFLYLYMGVLTTIVNIVAFEIFKDKFATTLQSSTSWKVAEIIAFIIAVIFAFITNKIFVFKSLSVNPFKIFSELGMFLGARVITECINFFIMWIMIDKNGKNESLTKIIASVIVIVTNYIFSKFIIFKKKKNETV